MNIGGGLEHALGPMALLLAMLALGGAPIAVAGLPAAILSGAGADSWPEWSALVSSRDPLVWVALAAGYGLLNLELAYVAVEVRRQGRAGGMRALCTVMLLNVAVGFIATALLGMRGSSPSVRFAGDVLALAMRWIANPVICLYWLRSGRRTLREGGMPALVALYVGGPILWILAASLQTLIGEATAARSLVP